MDRFFESLVAGVLILGTLLTIAWVVDAQAKRNRAAEAVHERCTAKAMGVKFPPDLSLIHISEPTRLRRIS